MHKGHEPRHDRVCMTRRMFQGAEQTVAGIVQVAEDQICIEIGGEILIVNWQASMLCAGAQREAVKHAVLTNVYNPSL